MDQFQEVIKKVEEHYDLQVQSYQLVKRTKDKNMDRLVFKLETTEGHLIFKNPPISEKEFPFFLESQQYLYQQGVKISEIIQTNKNEASCPVYGNHFVLFKYIEGRQASRLSLAEILAATRTMGELHAKSVGFVSRIKASSNRMIMNWPKEYSKLRSNLQKWLKKQKKNKKELQPLLMEVPFFVKTAEAIVKEIENINLVEMEQEYRGQCHIAHGDFTMGNIVFAEESAYLIDFDKVCYAFPSKDFNLFYRRVMKYQETRDAKIFKEMLNSYELENPMPASLRKLFLIDLIFPHYLDNFLRKKRYRSMSNSEVNELVKTEVERTKYLFELLMEE
jgi:CotS family spore coat protein